MDIVAAEGAVGDHEGRIAPTAAGRSKPPIACRFPACRFIAAACPSALHDGIRRWLYTRFGVIIIIERDIKVFVCLGIAQQEYFVLCVIATIDIPFNKTLTFAVIYICQHNALLLIACKCLVQECSVQPCTKRAFLPCDAGVARVIRLCI